MRAAAGEVVSPLSRRDARATIGSARSKATGLAPYGMIAKDMGRVSMRKRWDCFAYVLCSDLLSTSMDQDEIIGGRSLLPP